MPAKSQPTSLDSFVSMSSILTGFDSSKLAPAVDVNDLKTLYFDTANAQTDGLATALADCVQQMLDVPYPRQDIGNMLVGNAPWYDPSTPAQTVSAYVALAKAISKLWYLGTWYPSDPTQQSFVVSDVAYTTGLAWQVMQSHAMGNSTYTTEYWASPPAASLADYTGVKTQSGETDGSV